MSGGMNFEKVEIDEKNYIRIPADKLKNFVKDVFVNLGVDERGASVTADILVDADLKGIESHGVQRLKRYVDGLKNGVVNPRPNIKVEKSMPSAVLVDGDFGLGQIAAHFSMNLAIERAKKYGSCVVLVKNSNHFGIAGYYAEMAAKNDMIGLAMTNARPLVAPTGSVEKLLGTNPIAFASPYKENMCFLLDMATSIVTSGKMEVYRRKGKNLPAEWAINSDGEFVYTPEEALWGALLPLGGLYEITGGHKGYGLGMMVEILSGILSGANFAWKVGNTRGPERANVGHFFMAVNPEIFMPLEEFKNRMEELIEGTKKSKKHPEFKKIWFHGERSQLTRETRLRIGVPIYKKVYEEIKAIGRELGVGEL